jgi:hypothetical protein
MYSTPARMVHWDAGKSLCWPAGSATGRRCLTTWGMGLYVRDLRAHLMISLGLPLPPLERLISAPHVQAVGEECVAMGAHDMGAYARDCVRTWVCTLVLRRVIYRVASSEGYGDSGCPCVWQVERDQRKRCKTLERDFFCGRFEVMMMWRIHLYLYLTADFPSTIGS